MPSDLTYNLISEAMGIIVTVAVVDRLIVWRQDRKWRNVQFVLLRSSSVNISGILSAWGTFFISQNPGKTEEVRALWTQWFPYLYSNDHNILPSYKNVRNRQIELEIESFLGKSKYSQKKLTDLIKALLPELEALHSRFEIYSSMIDPQLAYPVSVLSFFFDTMRRLSEVGHWDEELKLMLDKDITHCLICSVQLMVLVRTKHHKLDRRGDFKDANFHHFLP